ncbi:putative saccharolysin [Talaromyces proteolyticus]|uniref:Saccharolysin n=1 Tax=Talaromyces proteolyticus TaxID=1131652 RepID=A0AAD4L212_9EURO|nr:putative saccharolysin [Talaromyces proteolyticus]KAH8703044.1 putative saccharolysin [Talaromyces proteolyticus]
MGLVLHSRATHPPQDSRPALSFRTLTILIPLLFFLSIIFVLLTTQADIRFNIRQGYPVIKSIPTSYPSHKIASGAIVPAQYRKPPQLPPLFTATNESLINDAYSLCTKKRYLLDNLATNIKPKEATFDNVLLPIVHEEDAAAMERRIIGFYQAVSTDSRLRDASSKGEEMMDECNIEASMREDIFALVQTAWDRSRKAGSKLDDESLRLLDQKRKSYIQNGLGIGKGPKRDRFKEIKKRLSQLSIEFQKNLNEENGGIWFTRKELEGVPEDILSGLEPGIGANQGKLKLSFKSTDLFSALKFALDAETRQRVFIQNENKLNQNVPLFKEAIILRDEAARLLGYPNYASFRIEDKMAKTPKAVTDFLNDIKDRLRTGGAKEVAHLMEIKSNDLMIRELAHTKDKDIYLWDDRFYNRLMVEQEFAIDEEKIAEYFPLQSTLEGMLAIFEQLMGFVFVELGDLDKAKISATGRAEDITWHKDVKMFSVWDDEGEGNGFVGYFYLDLHPRPGKFGHAANFSLQPGFILPNGTRRYPATALVCNFSKPTKEKPSLLKHDEIVLLFHELGHGIHDLAGRTKYSQFHGTSVVRDFVEAPSQMLENWAWTYSQLKSLSKHYETGESLPDDLIAKQINVRHVNDALLNLHQLHFGIFDMTVHTPKSHEEVESMKFSELYNDLRAQITGLKGPESLGAKSDWGNGQTTFGHLMGEYDAGYYGYLSSQVYSADIFSSVFKKNPMDGKEGRRYRHMVLERGGSQDEMKILEDFLGRKPSTEAFYQELGLM